MMDRNEITEEMVRKYASPDIVEALDESIKSYIKWGLMYLSYTNPVYTQEQFDEAVNIAHSNALGWLKRKYYTLFTMEPKEQEQIDTYKRLHKMEIESSLDNLMCESVNEIELIKI